MAIRWHTEGVKSNPAKEIKNIQNDNKIERFLSLTQTMTLLQAVRQSDSEMLQYIVLFLIYSGARKREVLDAKWQDIDWDQKSWRIPKTKSGKVRHVPLSTGALSLLLNLKRRLNNITPGTQFIFANPKTNKAFVSFYYSWNNARIRAGMPQFRIHDLRHSFASSLVNAGVGVLATLDGTASTDADRDLLTYTWTLLAKPTGSTATLSSTTSPKPTITPDVAGTYVASLVVNDGKVNSTAVGTTLTAAVANSAPVANAGPNQNVTTGSTVTLVSSGSTDANGDTLTYRWSMASKPTSSVAALSSATAASPTFTADLAGTYVVNLVVNDGKVDSSNVAAVTITASAANSAPVANAGANQTVTRTGTPAVVTVTLNGTGSTD
ncbi:MAG: site-specific integrase, partial [Betaproteobacteria bacterium]|nr:site-specific integrase [Betaproteobacteria bacterium]